MKTIALIILVLLRTDLHAFSQQKQCVKINSPSNGNTVQQIGSNIEFSTCLPVPSGKIAIPFIMSPDHQWWPYVGRVESTNSTNWILSNAQFGNDHDNGKTFKIIVLIVDENITMKPINIRGKDIILENNSPLSQLQFNAVLALYTEQSAMINVIRQSN